MNLIDENYNGLNIKKDEGVASNHIWYYSTEHKDFFLSDIFTWSNIKSNGYVIEIEGKQTVVPEHFFLAVGDYDIGLDCLQFAEIMGREYTAFTFNRTLEEDSWLLKPMRVVGYEENHSFYYPYFDHMFPIVVGDLAILVSSKDMYNRVKRLSFGDFV